MIEDGADGVSGSVLGVDAGGADDVAQKFVAVCCGERRECDHLRVKCMRHLVIACSQYGAAGRCSGQQGKDTLGAEDVVDHEQQASFGQQVAHGGGLAFQIVQAAEVVAERLRPTIEDGGGVAYGRVAPQHAVGEVGAVMVGKARRQRRFADAAHAGDGNDAGLIRIDCGCAELGQFGVSPQECTGQRRRLKGDAARLGLFHLPGRTGRVGESAPLVVVDGVPFPRCTEDGPHILEALRVAAQS